MKRRNILTCGRTGENMRLRNSLSINCHLIYRSNWDVVFEHAAHDYRFTNSSQGPFNFHEVQRELMDSQFDSHLTGRMIRS